MMYFLATMIVLFIWALCDVLKEDVKRKEIQEKRRKYQIPSEFWDDYNKAMFFIDRMDINEVSKVQYMVDNIITKYYVCLDYNTFIERIALLIEAIEKKKRSFLLNTQLN
jgi:hypothetical protein